MHAGSAASVLTGLLRRWREALPTFPAPAAAAGGDGGADSVLVDSATRTFWSRSTGTTTTLVEAAEPVAEVQTVGRRVAAMLAAREAAATVLAGREPAATGAAGPAGCEEHFVELLRQGSYELAYAQLAPSCQRRWGSSHAFAAAQGASAANLLGLSVREVRHLPSWRDADAGCVHHDVAELEVDYRVRLSASTAATVSRTVHLVAAPGGWRSVCYPQDTGTA
jgi:hypothetical protein